MSGLLVEFFDDVLNQFIIYPHCRVYICLRVRVEITHRFDALAVSPSGRIYVAWVDKRDLIAAKKTQKLYDGAAIYYAVSDDSGASFSAVE